MKFSEHLGKGVWTVTDKVMTVFFGLYFMKLSISSLPVEEYGIFTIIYQSVFLVIVNFGSSFALQPMMKFSAETNDYRSIMTAGLLMNAAFLMIAIGGAIACEPLLVSWFSANLNDAASLSELILLLPLMAVSFFARNYILYILQAKYDLFKLVVIDTIYFLAAIGLMHYMIAEQSLKNAADLFTINIYAYALSSIAAFFITWKYWRFCFRGLASQVKRMYDFGKFSLMSAFANNIYEQSDNYMIISLLSPRELGIYAVAKTFLRVFLLFSQIAQSLLVPVLSRQFARNAKDIILTICEKAVCFSVVLLLPVSAVFILFAGTIIRIMTPNPDFSEAAVIIQWSALLSLFVPWNSVFGCVYVAANQMKTAFYINAATIFLNLFFSWILISLMGVQGAILSVIIINIVAVFLNKWILKRNQLLDITLYRVLCRVSDIKHFIMSRGRGIEEK